MRTGGVTGASGAVSGDAGQRWRPFCSQTELSTWFVERNGSEPLCLSFISVVTVVNYDRSNVSLTR